MGLAIGSGGVTLYSASWDCNDGSLRIALNEDAYVPDVTVMWSSGSVAAAKSKVQDLPGRTVYEAALPDDTILSIRAVSVDGRAASIASEVVRTEGACTGEAVFVTDTGTGAASDSPPAEAAAAGGLDGAPAGGRAAAGDDGGDGARPPSTQPGTGMQPPADGAPDRQQGQDQAASADRPSGGEGGTECAEGMVERGGECVAAAGEDERGAQPPAARPGAADGGACLIATAAFGTELAPQVQMLRELRDETVLSTGAGAAFVSSFSSAYYAFSPHVADLEREFPALRHAAALLLAPMLHALQVVELAEPGSERGVVSYGIAAIALIAGMYAAAPAAGAWYAARRLRLRPRAK